MPYGKWSALAAGVVVTTACAGSAPEAPPVTSSGPTQPVAPTVVERVVEIPVPVVQPAEILPAARPHKAVSGARAADIIARSGTIVPDPRNAIGSTYAPPLIDGYRYTAFLAVNQPTGFEMPIGWKLDSIAGADLDDGQGVAAQPAGPDGLDAADLPGWQIRTHHNGRGDNLQYHIFLTPRVPKLRNTVNFLMTRPDGMPQKIIVRIHSTENTRHDAVRFIPPDLPAVNAALQQANLEQGPAGGGFRDSDREGICGVGSNENYQFSYEGPELRWLDLQRGDVASDRWRTCIRVPPENASGSPLNFKVVMPHSQEIPMRCSAQGSYYVCDGTPVRFRAYGTAGSVLIERAG